MRHNNNNNGKKTKQKNMYFLSVSPKAVHSECVAHAGSTTDSLVRAPSERLVDRYGPEIRGPLRKNETKTTKNSREVSNLSGLQGCLK